MTGRCETYIVQTFRHEQGDRISIECIDENRAVTRVASVQSGDGHRVSARQSDHEAAEHIGEGYRPGPERSRRTPWLHAGPRQDGLMGTREEKGPLSPILSVYLFRFCIPDFGRRNKSQALLPLLRSSLYTRFQ